tara:strand:+ start:971 stop:1573 length:603 start_codon:yes stop_codon:yes gene_type:complete
MSGMNAAEAVRFVVLHFLETYKEYLDEDNYESAKILIEQTPENKVVQKVAKILKPFAQQSEKGKLTKKSLIEQGWIDDKCSLKSEEIADMGRQAEMAFALCSSISEMDPEKLKGIESLASSIQKGIESQLNEMSESDKSNMNPADMIASALGGVEGGPEVSEVVSSLMSAMMPDRSSSQSSKKNLMDSFSKIDGNVGKRK